MTRVHIVVPDDFPTALAGSAPHARLETVGHLALFSERGADDEAVLAQRIADADVVINIRAYSRFNERVLAQCPRLRVISVWGTGVDHIDLAACRARGITVCNTPSVNAHAVAEHTMALMLAATRQIPMMDAKVRAGEWPRGLLAQLEGRTLGVIGLGAIGRRVATLAGAFGMRVIAWTWSGDGRRAEEVGATPVPIDTLLRESDIVSLHLRSTPDSAGFLGWERLALMKPTAILVNTARAALVDRGALVDALERGRIACAALDVFHEEPTRAGDRLLALPNVILTPHNAGMTREVIDRGLGRAVENVERFLAGEPRDVVS
jgi:phosphoglycerate dehydrogenase-like enzyme